MKRINADFAVWKQAGKQNGLLGEKNVQIDCQGMRISKPIRLHRKKILSGLGGVLSRGYMLQCTRT